MKKPLPALPPRKLTDIAPAETIRELMRELGRRGGSAIKKSPTGFALLSPAKRRQLQSKGGKTAARNRAAKKVA